ncbi:MAG TPA: ABC transporter ATP-binding protein [Terrimesophilobacter sp.]|nr:ABC transporter ATP-binding protein [Terrimesophilobacter sp.]
MTLIADLEVRRGDFTLDARIRVDRGETLALLGPNGSGKSTMLAAIAGLLTPRRGQVDVDGRVLTRVDEARRPVLTPPHRRRIGLLGQEPLLFPHLSALENVAFGPRSSGGRPVRGAAADGPRATAADARSRALRWLDDVGLSGLAARKPAELSGGQQQRVAIARALAAEPGVLLLDEPMAALDVETAALIRSLLRERLAAANLATVIVTHDVVDALVLADRVAILDDGRILDSGEASDVLGRPANRFAAALAGLNLVEGTLETGGVIRLPDGRPVRTGDAVTPIPDAGDRVTAVFPPTAVRIVASPTVRASGTTSSDGIDAASPAGDQAVPFPATVARLEPAVRGVRVTFAGDDIAAECSVAELLALGVGEGSTVSLSIDPAFVTAYPAKSPLGVMG